MVLVINDFNLANLYLAVLPLKIKDSFSSNYQSASLSNFLLSH